MTIRICDKCKSRNNDEFVIAEISWPKTDISMLGYWIGRKEKVELCRICIEELWKIKK